MLVANKPSAKHTVRVFIEWYLWGKERTRALNLALIGVGRKKSDDVKTIVIWDLVSDDI